MRSDGPGGHVIGGDDGATDDGAGAVVGGEACRAGHVTEGQEGRGAEQAVGGVGGRSGEGRADAGVEARDTLGGGARQGAEGQGERLARSRRQGHLVVAGGHGEPGDGLGGRRGGVAEELEGAALHVEAGSRADLVVVVGGVIEAERAFVDVGRSRGSQAAVVAGEGRQAGADLLERRRAVAREARADGAAVEVDVAAGDGEHARPVDVGGAERRTLAEDEAGSREGERAHVEDRGGAVAILGEEETIEIGRHDGVVGAEVHDRAVTEQQRGVGAGGGVEGKDAGGVEVEHRADAGDHEVVAERHRGDAVESPGTAGEIGVGRAARGEAARDHADGAGVAEEVEAEGGGGDGRRVSDGSPALPFGAEADGRGTGDDAVGRLAGRTDEDERTAVQKQVAAGAEAARGAAGVGHGRELQLAARDGDVAGEGVEPAQAHGPVGLGPTAEVVVDGEREGAGDHPREMSGAGGAGAAQGDAARTGQGDVPRHVERRLDAVREVDAERGTDAERDRTG